MEKMDQLQALLRVSFDEKLKTCTLAHDEITIEIEAAELLATMQYLRDEPTYDFSQLIDLCGVDYAEYGMAHWQTDKATGSGFDRAVEQSPQCRIHEWPKPRFAVVYHLLSISHNWRLRVRVFVDEQTMLIPSLAEIYSVANWLEREAFDLYGIIFDGHPDMRRILTDYGFIGHPFRKDFPISGHVEPRYDAHQSRVVYEKVDIQPRTLVPKVIRDDNRYLASNEQEEVNG